MTSKAEDLPVEMPLRHPRTRPVGHAPECGHPEHHQRKLQWVKPPRVQVEYLCQLLREKHHHRKLVPVTTTVRTRCKGQGAGGVHNAAIIVTCVRVHNSNFLGQGIEEHMVHLDMYELFVCPLTCQHLQSNYAP